MANWRVLPLTSSDGAVLNGDYDKCRVQLGPMGNWAFEFDEPLRLSITARDFFAINS